MPGRSASDTNALAEGIAKLLLLVDDELGRPQSFDLAQYCLKIRNLGQPESTARKIKPGDSDAVVLGKNRCDEVVSSFGQQCLVRESARRDDASDLAFDRSLAGGWVAHLFTNGHGLAFAHQLGEVAFHCVVWHTCHRDRVASRFSARRERDIEELGGAFRVVVEDLVEVTHTIQHDHIRVLGLNGEVLPHHGSVYGGDFGFHSYCLSRPTGRSAAV